MGRAFEMMLGVAVELAEGRGDLALALSGIRRVRRDVPIELINEGSVSSGGGRGVRLKSAPLPPPRST